MAAIRPRHRSIVLVALAVAAVLAGFLFGTSVSGAEYARVGSVAGGHQAYAVPVDDGVDRLRLGLEPEGEDPHAELSVFDPEDAFVTQLELDGEADTVDVFTERPGDWVVYVTAARQANVTVELAGGAVDEDVDVTELPVRRDTRTLVEQGGGSLDERLVWEVRRAPAAAHLTWSGEIEDLEATVTSPEGPVYEVETGGDGEASTTVTPANTVVGTYEATVEADSFDGELAFVRHEYVRDPVDLDGLSQEEKLEAVRNGTTVARAEVGEAIEIDTVAAEQALFWVAPDAHAHVRVFDDRDRFVEELSLGSHECRTDCPEDHGDDLRIAQFADLPQPGTYVAYVALIEEGETVAISLPVDDAPRGVPLEVERHELQFQHGGWQTEPQRDTVRLPGALVDASIDAQDTASAFRNVTVEGPLGPALHYEEEASSFGSEAEPTVHVERFTSGRFDVTVEAGSAAGTTYVELVHYAR